MASRARRISIAISALCGIPGIALSQATFEPLGFILGSNHTEALALSSDGTTVVGMVETSGGQFGFRWRSGTGMLAIPDAGPATGVSADGSIVYGHSNGCFDSYRWTQANGVIYLPPIAFSTRPFVLCCSDDGVVAGGRECITIHPSQGYALRWTMTGGYQIAEFNEGPVLGLSADGSVAVGELSPNVAPNWQPFRWTAAGLVGLGMLDPTSQPSGAAYGVSDDGSIVVGIVQGRAFSWTPAGGYQVLGVGAARAVNQDGSVIAGGSWGAWVWTDRDGQQSLQDLLVAGGARAVSGIA